MANTYLPLTVFQVRSLHFQQRGGLPERGFVLARQLPGLVKSGRHAGLVVDPTVPVAVHCCEETRGNSQNQDQFILPLTAQLARELLVHRIKSVVFSTEWMTTFARSAIARPGSNTDADMHCRIRSYGCESAHTWSVTRLLNRPASSRLFGVLPCRGGSGSASMGIPGGNQGCGRLILRSSAVSSPRNHIICSGSRKRAEHASIPLSLPA